VASAASVAGLVAVLTVSCVSSRRDLRGPQVHEYDDGTTVLVAGSSDGESDARLPGTLVVGPGGCIGVDVGGRTIPVVFGNSTVRDAATFVVQVDDDAYEVGDRVVLGGGSSEPPYPSRVPDPPARCVSDETELFIANGS
jgi:hypothetical protein